MGDNPVEDNNKDTVIGRVKQAAGDLTDDQELEAEGEAQEASGKVKEFVDDAADTVTDAVDEARRKLT